MVLKADETSISVLILEIGEMLGYNMGVNVYF